MILLAYVARISDGMLLVASMDTMVTSSEELGVYKNQGREIIKQLHVGSPAKCDIESDNYVFHYVIKQGVCYLVMTRKGYPKQLAFRYLEDVSEAFVKELSEQNRDWQSLVERAARPYAFIKFDKTLQRKRREYADPSDRRNQAKLDDEIAGIAEVMKRNIDEVLNRGEKLDRLYETTSQLKSEAHKYKWGTKKYAAMVYWQQYAPLVAIFLLLAFVAYVKLRF